MVLLQAKSRGELNVAHEEKVWQETVGAKDKAQATLQTRIRELELRQASQPAEKPLGAKERDSLLKIVIGLALDSYKYDPKRPTTTPMCIGKPRIC